MVCHHGPPRADVIGLTEILQDPLHILCVDDDRDTAIIIALSLSLDPTIVARQASNGAEALALLQSDDWSPDCLLIDARMPQMSGADLLAAIRRIPRYRDTPVIFLTADVRACAEGVYKALGARGMIGKPFDPLALVGQVRALL